MSRLLPLLLYLICCASVRAETPSQFSKRFFHALYKWEVRGAPDNKELNRLSPYLGSDLLQLFKRVEIQRDQEHTGIKHKHRNDPNPPILKGIWSKEGDLFTSVAESFSTFAIGKPQWRRERMNVPVHLEYGDAKPASSWTVTLILDKNDKAWVVSDILDEDGESLMANLTGSIAENERYLQSLRE